RTIKELTRLYRQVLTEISSILRPDGRVSMTIPVIITEDEQVSVKFRELTRGTGLSLYRMLPSDSIKSRRGVDPRLKIRPGRELIPERKQGQIVQRALIVLEK
ncbi:MAG: hypothetical protein ACFFBL_13095, partial [Promethearchaeota archaeon]